MLAILSTTAAFFSSPQRRLCAHTDGRAAVLLKLVTNRLAASAGSSLRLPAGPLSEYLGSRHSDEALLSATSVSGPTDGVYECELSPIKFFTLAITPVFTMQIDREPAASAGGAVAVRVLKGQCRVGEKLSRTISIDALNEVRWAPEASGGWSVDTAISLELAIKQAPLRCLTSPGAPSWPRRRRR